MVHFLAVLVGSFAVLGPGPHLPHARANADADTEYVEFDLSSLPTGEGTYKVQLTVRTADKDITFSEPMVLSRRGGPKQVADDMQFFLDFNRYKAEVVGGTKLRVYGRRFNDKLIPATKGEVESADLRPEELPKVTLVGKKG